MSAPTPSDRIEKVVTLNAPVSRVWRAVADSAEFGRWFGVTLGGPFVEGRALRGTFTGELPVDAIASQQRALGLPPSPVRTPPAVFCTVERVEPERALAFRWIPYGIDAAVDPAHEPTTLVEFRLEAVPEGTRLTITESGFDKVPEHRRRRAFLMNDAGWAEQAKNIARHVEG